MLARLAASWNETTSEFLFGTLWHQGSCYGATYAAIPHLLKIAQPDENRHQRRDIAPFLAQVALDSRNLLPKCAPRVMVFSTACPRLFKVGIASSIVTAALSPCSNGPTCRTREHREHQLTVDLPRYRKILATEPVNADDLENILTIEAEFFSALPAIRAPCERTLFETVEESEFIPYLLSGIADADGLLDIAGLLNQSGEGSFRCPSCNSLFEFIRFGERIAVYAVADGPRICRPDDKRFRDYQECAPSQDTAS